MKPTGTGISEGYVDRKSQFIDISAFGKSEQAFGDP